MSRPTSFGRQLPSAGWWLRLAPAHKAVRFWDRPTQAAVAAVLAALVIGNALILYRLSSNADDPGPTALLSGRSGLEPRSSFEDVGTTLQSIRAAIEARVEGIEPINIGMAPKDRPRQTISDRRVAPTRNASESSDRGGSSSTSSDSSAGSTSVGTTSGTSGESGSDGTAGAGTTSGGGGATGGSGDTADTGGTSGGGAGGGGGGGAGGGGGGSGVGTDVSGGGGGG